MAKILTGPPRFTHPEWTASNKTKYKSAELERASAERLVDESKRLSEETAKTTQRTQDDVNKKFEQRLDDIKFWKEELDNKLAGLSNEIDSLLAYKTRLEKALESCEEPIHISHRCLENRERRTGIDLVHDDVQKELLKEVETIDGVKALLKRTLEQTDEQIRLNRKAKYRLEKDLKDKFKALNIDEFCENLKNNSPGLEYKDGVAKIEANSVTPVDWEDFSNENIDNAACEENASIQLRSLIDGILQQTANDMQKQNESVNLAFNKRIDETSDTKGKLEEHLSRVLGQIKEMEENIAVLQKNIKDKEEPLKLSETRLGLRQERPNVELCRDQVQYKLVQEVNEIQTNIDRLQEQLAGARSSLKGLIRRQLDLQEDIEVKANTLFIDEVECMGMRKSINIQAF